MSGPGKAKVLQLPVEARLDNWSSVLTGIGNATRDKRMSARFAADRLPQEEAEELWEGDAIAARIVEKVPDEMVREGFEAKVGGPKGSDISEEVEAVCDDLDVLGKTHTALCYERAYGGAAILLGADDGQNPKLPLDLKRVKRFEWMTVLTPRELAPSAYYTDPTAPKYGETSVWRIQLATSTAQNTPLIAPLVHETRLIRLKGIQVSRRRARERHGFGSSVLQRCVDVVRDFGMSWGAASLLLIDFAQAVLKVKGLAELIASNDSGAVVNRAQMLEASRSIARTLVMDSEEEFIRQTTSVAGLPEMLREMATWVAATADMPVSLLMGMSPAGLNATGESETRFFYAGVRSRQKKVMRPILNAILKTLFASKAGPTAGKEPDNWSVCFPPLWTPSDTELAAIRLQQAQADQIYINTQVLLPEEVAKSRFGGDAYSTDTKLDEGLRAAFKAAAPEPGADPNADPEAGDGGEKNIEGAPTKANATPPTVGTAK